MVSEGKAILMIYAREVCSKIVSLYSEIVNPYSKTAIVRDARFILARETSDPPLELSIESGGPVEATATVDFRERVVSFVE